MTSAPISRWCNSGSKRSFDIVAALLLLAPALPLMLVIAVLVKLSSPGPVLFRQCRPGKDGTEFNILKFRTMRDDRAEHGPMLTRSGDPRLTWVGSFLRKCKLDELPQLLNVLRGDMSFVGPRPQPVRLWQNFTELPAVLRVRPGITGAATLAFRHEEELLQPLPADQVEEFYTNALMPLKLQLDLEHLQNASFLADILILIRTALCLVSRHQMHPSLRVMVDLLSKGALDRALSDCENCVIVGGYSAELLHRYVQWKRFTANILVLVVPDRLQHLRASAVPVVAVSNFPDVLRRATDPSVFILPDVVPADTAIVRRACARVAVPVYSFQSDTTVADLTSWQPALIDSSVAD